MAASYEVSGMESYLRHGVFVMFLVLDLSSQAPRVNRSPAGAPLFATPSGPSVRSVIELERTE